MVANKFTSSLKVGGVVFLLLTFSLTGCQKRKHDIRFSTEESDMTPGITQRVGVSDKHTFELAKGLEQKGVQILSVGQDYRVIIPYEKLYNYSSPKIRWGSYVLLNAVVEYLKQFRKVSLKVSAYSEGENKRQAAALSYARARNLVNYLWDQDIDARLVYMQAHSIHRDRAGRAPIHATVEISFRNVII